MDSFNSEQKIKKKKRKKKNAKIYFTLTSRDQELLMRFCEVNKVTKTVAVRKIIHAFLQENVNQDFGQPPDNQLGLFDPVQMDIFDLIRK